MNQCKLLLFGLFAVLILPASAGSFGQYGPTKRRRDRMDHWWRRNERRNCSSRPHIIFIMADDQGWNDVGFHNPLVDTPNINWLAENGIELTDYHTAPVCSASRAALLTGRYPSRTGIHQGVLLPRSKTCLPLELSTLPEMLKDNGYTTKMIGKWHLGSCNASCLPTSRGFDEFRGSIDATIGYFNWSQNGVMSRFVNDQPSTANLGTHLTIQHQRDAREMIMAHKDVDSPLFMFISPLAPHAPLEVTREMFDRHPFLDETDEQQRQRRESLGLVAALDDLVGETIQALRDAGLYDNSIVIFSSDNGGSSARLGHGSEDFGNNYPYRGSKSELYEGGHRVPAVYHSPHLPARERGTKRDFLMHITDWLPTFGLMINHRYRSGDIDGVSQLTNLRRPYHSRDKYRVRSEHLVFITNYASLVTNCSNSDAAYRWNDWKLIYGKSASLIPEEKGLWIKPAEAPQLPNITGDSCDGMDENGEPFVACLFNLKDDPYEQRNLYNTHPQIVERLKAKIDFYKSLRVKSVIQFPIGATPVTTTTLDGLLVPRTDYCDPSLDSLLQRPDPLCDA